MKKNKKRIAVIITALIIAAAGYGFYLWNKPRRDVKDEEGLKISAAAIYDSFILNETRANALYLDKAIQVSGEVSEFKKNQDGQPIVYLKTADPIFGVNCTFKEDPGVLQKGSTITFKGICKGYLSDVVITEGIIVKE